MTSTLYHLVHANIATPLASLDDPLMRGFVNRINEIDAQAQGWPGFIAQPTLLDEGLIFTEPILLNVSVWDSIENLRDFTYSSRHAELLKMRAEWFVQAESPAYVLYWFLAGEIPSEAEIKEAV